MSNGDQKTQDYHAAIKNVVEHLKSKRQELQNDITTDELEKAQVAAEVSRLQDRLSILNANLRKKSEFRREYDKAISQSEEHFVELLQKSEDFLSLTRREALALSSVVSDAPRPPAAPTTPTTPTTPDAPPPKPAPPRAPDDCGPPAVLMVHPPDADACAGCPGPNAPCATIMVPYRANGL